MKFVKTQIPEVILIEPQVFGDERGFFMETWRNSWLEELGIDVEFIQDNHSMSRKGILRGLHYQIQQPQGKLVRVVRGEVFDVAVDLRRESPTFGKWVGEILSEQNKRMLWVPPGFAHGFLVTSDEAEFVYKCTSYYAPEHDRTLLWNDSKVGIDWPLDGISEVLLSEKDKVGKPFDEADVFEMDIK
ncbi:dTDP-4-dehydrorhamnose 3,5-epimerase [Ketobacter sp. MCCC 1A13808]|uniref:dTDP-4-dehydrorhamnose 3,5-epimerase n=1 Tax=Ketobacter sp. MCCC 1A13808 TaxID=2602738 RepID=UPI000F2194C3|nr:dTDP-4-dehydrorhamnose 3,5-epimerase [Ketobacter sp. MCCC 1A13808]MVF13919.1 dTDP-4-dehydrorhamnose 3,5-epimerase [Ketobacter sp. MCCC 1A13808]RLP53482.1 MAG: dTDP-4-dehydrorhamnose 3,5-epimerase [Ketobacter sp.]